MISQLGTFDNETVMRLRKLDDGYIVEIFQDGSGYNTHGGVTVKSFGSYEEAKQYIEQHNKKGR